MFLFLSASVFFLELLWISLVVLVIHLTHLGKVRVSSLI